MPKNETPAEKLERKSREETGRAPAGSPKDRAGAKRPQDRKKPAPKPNKDGMLDVELDGVKVTVDTNGMRDWRFIESSGAVEAGAGGPAEIYQVVALVIPDRNDRARISEHVKDDTGFVDVQRFFEFYQRLVQEAGAKNS
ncbi:hypothetical protein AABM36_08310 [Kocuria sp. KSNUG]|uniref:hypothetical protein n=1 Tax=Kocuria sp. KSNUG TaxID=3136676 RepID=UPI003C2CB385